MKYIDIDDRSEISKNIPVAHYTKRLDFITIADSLFILRKKVIKRNIKMIVLVKDEYLSDKLDWDLISHMIKRFFENIEITIYIINKNNHPN